MLSASVFGILLDSLALLFLYFFESDGFRGTPRPCACASSQTYLPRVLHLQQLRSVLIWQTSRSSGKTGIETLPLSG